MDYNISDLFHSVSYQKTMLEIREKAEQKVTALRAKIDERHARIERIRKEAGIDDALELEIGRTYAMALTSNHLRSAPTAMRTGSDRVIGVGTIEALSAERTAIHSEEEAIKRLEMMLRNLRPLAHVSQQGTITMIDWVNVTPKELEFLGF